MLALQVAGESLRDQLAGLLNSIKRHKRAKAGATALPEQHRIKHGEPIIGNAWPLGCGALGFHILVARYVSRDIIERGLDGFSAGPFRQNSKRGRELFERLALGVIRLSKLFAGRTKSRK